MENSEKYNSKRIIELLRKLENINKGKCEFELSKKDISRIEKIGEIIQSEKLLENDPEKDFHKQIMMIRLNILTEKY